MNTTYTTNTTKALQETKTSANREISRISVAAISFTALFAGCWATACLFAGTISSNGPVGLVQNLITAISG